MHRDTDNEVYLSATILFVAAVFIGLAAGLVWVLISALARGC